MPLVQMPTGEVVNMPDDPTPKQIAELELLHSPSGLSSAGGSPASPTPTQQPTSGTDIFLHRLGILGRGLATGVTGTVGLVGDALNSGINMAAGTHLGMPSTLIQNGMTNLGLPVPQQTDEKIAGGLAAFAGGMLDPVANGVTSAIKAAPALGGSTPLYDAGTQATGVAATLANAQQEGYHTPPSASGSSNTGKLLEALSGSGPNAQQMKYFNQGITGDIVRREIGLPKAAPLDDKVLNNLIQDTYDTGYAPLAKIGTIKTSPKYYEDLMNVMRENNGVNPSFPDAANQQVYNLASRFDVPQFDSAHALQQIKSLRSGANDAFRTGNTEMGHASRGIADALENAIENHLSTNDANLLKDGILEGTTNGNTLSARASGPELLANFRDARTALAKQYAVRDALVPGSGEINPMLLRGDKRLTGGLKTIGDFASAHRNLIGYAAQEPPLLTRMESTGLAGAAAGHAFGLPTGVLAAIPGARMATRQLLSSRMGQQLFSQPAIASDPATNPLINALPTLVNGGLWNMGQ